MRTISCMPYEIVRVLGTINGYVHIYISHALNGYKACLLHKCVCFFFCWGGFSVRVTTRSRLHSCIYTGSQITSFFAEEVFSACDYSITSSLMYTHRFLPFLPRWVCMVKGTHAEDTYYDIKKLKSEYFGILYFL